MRNTNKPLSTAYTCHTHGPSPGAYQVKTASLDNNSYSVTVDDSTDYCVKVLRLDQYDPHSPCLGRLVIEIEGTQRDLIISRAEDGRVGVLLDGYYEEISIGHNRNKFGKKLSSGQASTQTDWTSLKSPMPAVVSEILVTPAMVLRQDQELMRLEAMKMVITLTAPRDCIVQELCVVESDSVKSNQILARLQPCIKDD